MNSILHTLDHHVALISAEEVYAICKPFFDEFQFNYFDITYTYPDGSFTSLTSDAKWYRYFFEKNYHISSTIVETGVHLWKNYESEETVRDAESLYNHHNGITICKKYDDHCEFYDFATPKEHKTAIDFYLNHIDVLEQFFCYFKENAFDLLQEAIAHPLKMPTEMQGILQGDDSNKIDSFLQTIKVNRYHFSHMQEDLFITGQEMQVLLLVAQGYSIKEAAKKLQLSPRTAETYFANAKMKLGTYAKGQLLDLIRRYYPHLIPK